jgi:hypothetical protein
VVVAVLISVSEFVKGKALPSIFTFKRELVMTWLIAAKQACCLPTIIAEEGYYGGPPFVDADPSTHWSEPHQLYTWWKNNVERRSKFKVLQEDAKYKGLDPKRLQRARWCEAVVALSEVIRASSGSSNASRSNPPIAPGAVGEGPHGYIGGGAGGDGAGVSSTGHYMHAPGLPLTEAGSLAYAGMAGLTPHDAYAASFAAPVVPPGVAGSAVQRLGDAGSGAGGLGGAAGTGIDALLSMSNQAPTFLPSYSHPVATVPPLSTLTAGAGAEATGGNPTSPAPATQAPPSPGAAVNSGSGVGDLPSGPLLSSASTLSPSGVSASLHRPTQPMSQPQQGEGRSSMYAAEQPPLAGDSAPLSGGGGPGPFRPNTGPGPAPPASSHLGSSHLIPGTNIPYRNYSNTFPVKLFDLVSAEDEAVVGWQGHGTSFQVRNMDKFVNEVLPKHFKRKSSWLFTQCATLLRSDRSSFPPCLEQTTTSPASSAS